MDAARAELDHQLDEPHGEPIEAHGGRAEEQPDQHRIGAVVHEDADARRRRTGGEPEQVLRLRAGEPQAGPPGARRPQHDHFGGGRRELLCDEGPEPAAGERDPHADHATEQRSQVAPDGKGPELHLPAEQRLLDDDHPPDGEDEGECDDDRLEVGEPVHRCPPAAQHHAQDGEREAGHDDHPEGGVLVIRIQLLALDDGGRHALSLEQVDEQDVHRRHGDRPERLGAENGGEQQAHRCRDELLSAGHEERPPDGRSERRPLSHAGATSCDPRRATGAGRAPTT